MTTDPDGRALQRLRAGEPGAQEAFFHRYVDGVRAFVRRCLARTDVDADEITVDTFYRSFRGISRFEGRSSVRVWLISIARIAAADHHRALRRAPLPVSGLAKGVEIDAGLGAGGPRRESAGTPLASVVRAETRQRLLQHMDRLTDDHREVITLRLLTGLDNRDAAEAMGRSPDALKMLLFRGLVSLQRRLRADPYFREAD